MSKLAILASTTIDFVNGQRRCGGSAIYSPLSLYIVGFSHDLYYIASGDYPFDFPFEGKRIEVDRDFEFHINYIGDERRLKLSSFPKPLKNLPFDYAKYSAVLVNPLYNEIPIKFLAPLVNEIDISSFDLQGFLRVRDPDGTIRFRGSLYGELREIISHAKIVKVGEDEFFFREPLGEIFIVTRGTRGCSLYLDGQWIHVPSHKVDKVGVGTGDMFISYFTGCYMDLGDPIECAVRSNALVSAILEKLEFVEKGCFSRAYLNSIREEVLELWEERIVEIRSRL